MSIHHHLIYIVEDDADDRFIMQEAFDELNFGEQVKMFATSESFLKHLELLSDSSSFPKLIVLDFNMPLINGGELLLRIKRIPRFQNIPVIVYSTGMRTVLKETLVSYGALECFNKGMEYFEFLEMARTFRNIAEQVEISC